MLLSAHIAIKQIEIKLGKIINKLLINNKDKFMIHINNKSRIEKKLSQGMLLTTTWKKWTFFKFDWW